jgi:hypothetical protein
LFRNCLVGAVRAGHPLTNAKITAARYAARREAFVGDPWT